jgi:hypothetical protein
MYSLFIDKKLIRIENVVTLSFYSHVSSKIKIRFNSQWSVDGIFFFYNMQQKHRLLLKYHKVFSLYKKMYMNTSFTSGLKRELLL